MRITPAWRRGARVLLATASVALPLGFGSAAGAAPEDSLTTTNRFVPGVGNVESTADGLMLVRMADGSVATTHGAESAPAAGVAGTMNTAYPGGNRPPRCTTIGSSTDWPNPGRVELVYVRARGGADNYAAAAPQMRWTLGRMNWWLNERAHATSGNLVAVDLNTFCVGNEIHVSHMTSTWAGSDVTYERLRNELIARGYTNRNVKYLVLFDDYVPDPTRPGWVQTGIADFRRDCNPGATNANNQSGSAAASMYGFVWHREFFYERGTTALHELMHTLGAVQPCAPHSTPGAHCYDDVDVMCYDDDDNGATYPMWNRCSPGTIDCGDDTYFDALAETNEPLYNVWNVGSLANRFIYWRIG